MDIQSRIMTFRIQAVQRLLYSGHSMWTDTACALLQNVDIFKYDKQLFLIRLMDILLSVSFKSMEIDFQSGERFFRTWKLDTT